MSRLSVVLIALAGLLGACSTAPQRLDLRPTIDITARNLGQGAPVAVQVIDRRQLTEAQRSGAVTGIDPAVNVVDVVYQEATRALEQLGFAVEPSAGPLSNTLTLELLQINYDLTGAVMKKTVFVDADVRATAKAGGNSYATTYRAHQEQEVAFQPAPALSQRLVNETLSSALSRVFADPQLMDVLTQRAVP
ncbi:YajG family lipoprotein [Immundisolibacter sp.]|uniref:YajG family lipoprotein n=1 Tax=Immundisolibacter sp. TaxID=1934948 RepID=UPI00261B65C4|nr:YajG family lipoprotein [Immundisolibacter sp.]MDD3650060.1 YajG family lipoprotein [Immundisolibacter sp.]